MDFPTSLPHDVSPVNSIDNLPHTMMASSSNTPRKSSSVYSASSQAPNLRTDHESLYTSTPPSITSSEPEDQGYNTESTTLSGSDACSDRDDVEAFRDAEWPMLKGAVYLDNAGSALPCKTLINKVAQDAINNLYGNPHSTSAPSALATHRVHLTRTRLIQFFGASPDEYDLVFTANATAAIKLVMESLRDHAAHTNTPLWYGYHKDAHTSLVGLRGLANNHRCFSSDAEVDNWINSGGLGGARHREIGLFAYPGQSNMTGRRLPADWAGRIRKNIRKAKTYTLYDAAAIASTSQLDLSDPATSPDFVALSLYKIFGRPDIGALLVKKVNGPIFEHRKYFGGGTVDMTIVLGADWHAKKSAIHEKLEDGTLPFHSIIEAGIALDVFERMFGPMPMKYISQHTSELARTMYEQARALRHANGRSVVNIYKDPGTKFGDPSSQGGTLTFNLVDPHGNTWGYEDIEAMMNDVGIYVRSGSLCNPGGMASYLGWNVPADMRAAFDSGHRCSEPVQNMFGRSTGVVRASVGVHNVRNDVSRLIHWLQDTIVDQPVRSRDEEPIALPKKASKFTATVSPSLSTNSSTTPTGMSIIQGFPAPPTSQPSQLNTPQIRDDAIPRIDSGLHNPVPMSPQLKFFPSSPRPRSSHNLLSPSPRPQSSDNRLSSPAMPALSPAMQPLSPAMQPLSPALQPPASPASPSQPTASPIPPQTELQPPPPPSPLPAFAARSRNRQSLHNKATNPGVDVNAKLPDLTGYAVKIQQTAQMVFDAHYQQQQEDGLDPAGSTTPRGDVSTRRKLGNKLIGLSQRTKR